jgi:hypothetical protein
MFARSAQGLDRRTLVGVPVKEDMMRRFLLVGGTILALISFGNRASAAEQEDKGKTCRMEQQCHWENFKKVCVWVKVCR